MFTSLFWKLSAERAVKTFAQTLAALLVADGAGLLTAGWTTALSTAAMAAVVSVLTSVGSVKVGPEGSPSVVEDCPAPARAAAPVARVTSVDGAPQPA